MGDRFWSPDSSTIAFFADNALKTTQTLCTETGSGNGGTWNRQGVILFFAESGSLKRVAAEGGACTAVIKAEPQTVRRAMPSRQTESGWPTLRLNRRYPGVFLRSLGEDMRVADAIPDRLRHECVRTTVASRRE